MISIKELRKLNLSNFFSYKLKKKSTKLKLFVFFSIKNTNILNNNIIVNNKFIDDYFPIAEKLRIIKYLTLCNFYKKYCFNVFVFINGGGLINQAKSIELAIKRAFTENIIINVSEYFSSMPVDLKVRDYRNKERKKFGLKKARKASQYHKR